MGRHEEDDVAVDTQGFETVAVRARHHVRIDPGRESIALGGCRGDRLGDDIGEHGIVFPPSSGGGRGGGGEGE